MVTARSWGRSASPPSPESESKPVPEALKVMCKEPPRASSAGIPKSMAVSGSAASGRGLSRLRVPPTVASSGRPMVRATPLAGRGYSSSTLPVTVASSGKLTSVGVGSVTLKSPSICTAQL